MKTQIVNETSKQVEAFNTRNAAAIEAGLMFPKVQSERAKIQEEEQKRREAVRVAELAEDLKIKNRLEEINLETAKKHGFERAVNLLVSPTYSNGFHTRKTGYRVEVAFTSIKGNYPLKDGKINYPKIRSRLEDYYAGQARKREQEQKALKAKEAAEQLVSMATLKALASAYGLISGLTVTLAPNGKINVVQPYSGTYDRTILREVTVEQIELVLEEKQRHQAAMAEILESE
jgi:hypothetical protein